MLHQIPIRINVEEKYKELFNSNVVETSLDFLTIDPRGNFVGYEIMTAPYKSKTNWAILEMVAEQYGIRVVPITRKIYERLERRFMDRINSDSRFVGWEEIGDNLKTNPEKYGRRVVDEENEEV